MFMLYFKISGIWRTRGFRAENDISYNVAVTIHCVLGRFIPTLNSRPTNGNVYSVWMGEGEGGRGVL